VEGNICGKLYIQYNLTFCHLVVKKTDNHRIILDNTRYTETQYNTEKELETLAVNNKYALFAENRLQWSPFIIIVILFTMLLPISTLSLFGMTFITDFLFNMQEIVPAASSSYIQPLQLTYAQEQDEEIDETEGEDDNDNGEEEAEDENNRQTNSIDICCSWDEGLANGILTYRIIEGEDEEDEEDEKDEENQKDDDEVNTNDDIDNDAYDLRKAVADAVNEWNTKIPNLKLVEISSTSSENENDNDDADIEVQFVEGFGGMAAGATMIRYDEDGFINKATILLPKAAFYIEHDSQIFAIQYDPRKLKEIATREMGHALGLGHANFDADLMSQRLSSKEIMNISQCDVNGVLQANQWKFVNNDNTPDNPNEDEVSC
jgi:predicted Zn-dependent protease